MRFLTPFLLSALSVLLSATFALAQPAPINSLYKQTSDVHHLMANYAADRGSLTRFYVIENSSERRQRLEKLSNDYLGQLQKMDFEKMPVDSQVDYILFQRNLQVDLRELAKEASEVAQTQQWFPFAEKSTHSKKQGGAGLR